MKVRQRERGGQKLLYLYPSLTHSCWHLCIGWCQTGELGYSSFEQTSMLHFESANKQTKKTTNQQQGEGGGRGSVLRPTRDGSQRKQTCKCVLRTGRTATKSPRHAYDPQMASCCESAHLCFWNGAGAHTSLVAQAVKNLPAMQDTRVRSMAWDDSLGKGKAAHFNILAWRIPWTEDPGGLQSMGVTSSQTPERLTLSGSYGPCAPPPCPCNMFSACLLSVENFSQRISSTREWEMLKQMKNKVKTDSIIMMVSLSMVKDLQFFLKGYR